MGHDRRATQALALTLLLVTVLWPVALLAAPYAATHHAGNAASLRLAAGVYIVGSRVCHQRSERSFHVWGVQLPVCARCTGVYIGAPLGVAAVVMRSRRRAWDVSNRRAWSRALTLAALPTVATLLWEWLTLEMVSGAVRAAAGASLGVAVGAFLAVASGGKSR